MRVSKEDGRTTSIEWSDGRESREDDKMAGHRTTYEVAGTSQVTCPIAWWRQDGSLLQLQDAGCRQRPSLHISMSDVFMQPVHSTTPRAMTSLLHCEDVWIR